ncbi:protein cereblon-like [Pieris brassicae]|uniref:protein cereblon-like n=1 Tax=Pieris brassicae TaxID=7116 RepID=UPI001E65F19F|nr:protein cereblon-like [Pieris brassicae]
MDDGTVSENEGNRTSGRRSQSSEEMQNLELDAEDFDITLAASHSYLSQDLVAITGRPDLEPGWTGTIPVMAHHGAVFPGETVPMLLTDTQDVLIISHALDNDKIFGLLCPDETCTYISGYGVLCEVIEASNSNDAPQTLSFRSQASHRFRFKVMPKMSKPIHLYNRMKLVEILILPEVQLGDPLQQVRLPSLDNWRRERTMLADNRFRIIDSAMTTWPHFVYDIFDFHRMKQTIKEYFRNIVKTSIPEEPVSLSFWTASNLTLTPRDRLALFMVDDALLRLHMEVRLIGLNSVLCCVSCSTEIARRENMFAMSTEGVHSNYINLGGYMHDLVTVTQTQNIQLSGPASAEFSWFPGYAWSIALCVCCMAHVGWRFDALKRAVRPSQFFGLCRNNVVPRPAPTPPLLTSTPPPANLPSDGSVSQPL